MPQDDVPNQRCDPFDTIYHCSGLTCDWTNAVDKSGFAQMASKWQVAMVFPDTSPRDVKFPDVDPGNWRIGYGAGHYCNATADGFKEHFNMYDYITKELPELC